MSRITKLTPEFQALLGTMPDNALARKAEVSVHTARAWRTAAGIRPHAEGGGPVSAPPPPPGVVDAELPYDAADMSPDEYARRSLNDLAIFIDQAAKRNSWVAVGQLKKREEEAYKLLAQARQQRDPFDEMTDDQLLELVMNAIAAMPREHVQRVYDTAASVINPRHLSVVSKQS